MIGMREAATDPAAAEAHYRTALELEAAGDRPAAIDELRKAIQRDNNPKHHFKLAYFLDLVGEEDEAIAIYEQICADERPHMNSLLNLSTWPSSTRTGARSTRPRSASGRSSTPTPITSGPAPS
jgi:tetratricopeptide (TPR) repeat protein